MDGGEITFLPRCEDIASFNQRQRSSSWSALPRELGRVTRKSKKSSRVDAITYGKGTKVLLSTCLITSLRLSSTKYSSSILISCLGPGTVAPGTRKSRHSGMYVSDTERNKLPACLRRNLSLVLQS
ncbi:hypothetical protein RRG08_040788 [Elysia crispata]|uniref:Uncharacterized protein n=1 Tax=Elysia crispata TaxID=231223 RepID=A0AAE1BF60_9GAST|nr:hypothetical protein RRG08_040788 [Elysia crispata]